MKPTCMAAAVILASVPPLAADPPDRLAEALSAVSFDRSGLGCRPKTWWSRFGHFAGTQRVPFFFPDLFAEPLRTYETSRIMAGAMEHFLAPSYRSAKEDGAFKTAYFLGFTHLSPGHRGYRAGGGDLPADPAEPLVAAMKELHRTGGKEAGADLLARVRAEAAALPRPLHRPLARFLWRLARAHPWVEEAFEGVAVADQVWIADEQAAHRIKYAPALRRASAEADLILLTNAVQQALQAAETAHRQLSAAVDSTGPVAARILWPTPLGRVLIAGTGGDEHGCADCLAVVDLAGADTYGAGAGAGPGQRISVILDLSGDDTYRGGGPGEPVQGAGVFGVGLLWDGGGNDRYEAEGMAQGSGFFGAGILWDEGDGTDTYRARFSAQGAGYFGLGLLVDGGGGDTYYLWGDGQGFGGPGGGIGVLGDAGGDDTYTAEVDARITGRGSYHTANRVTSSHAQGAAIGRRADLEEGYSWAGGLGALVDLSGDDVRRAGNWALGSGYWFGTGLVYDGGGSDLYEAVYYSMASGAPLLHRGDLRRRGRRRPLPPDRPAPRAPERHHERLGGGRPRLRLGLHHGTARRQGRRRLVRGAHHLRGPGHDPLHRHPRRPRQRQRHLRAARGRRRRPRRLPRQLRQGPPSPRDRLRPLQPSRHELRLPSRHRGPGPLPELLRHGGAPAVGGLEGRIDLAAAGARLRGIRFRLLRGGHGCRRRHDPRVHRLCPLGEKLE